MRSLFVNLSSAGSLSSTLRSCFIIFTDVIKLLPDIFKINPMLFCPTNTSLMIDSGKPVKLTEHLVLSVISQLKNKSQHTIR